MVVYWKSRFMTSQQLMTGRRSGLHILTTVWRMFVLY